MKGNYFRSSFLLKFIFFIAFYVLSISSFSQNPVLDSLKFALQNSREDTTKINILFNLYLEYRITDADKARSFVNQSYSLAIKLHYKKGIADALFAYGVMNLNQGNYVNALALLKRSLEISKQMHYRIGISNCLNTMGNVYRMKGDYKTAIDHFKKSLVIREAIKNKGTKDYARIGDCYNNLGNTYRVMGDYDRALFHYMKANTEFEKSRSEEKMIMLFNNLGTIYQDMQKYGQALDYYQRSLKSSDKDIITYAYINIGSVYIDQKIYNKAEDNFIKALKLAELTGNKEGIALALINLATVYFEIGNLEQAMKYDLQALKIAEEIGDKGKICDINIYIASNFNKQKKNEKALEYAEQALILAKELDAKTKLSQCYEALSEINNAQGNYKTSLSYYKLFTEIRDSLINTDKNKAIFELQTKYETDSKDKEILLLTKDRELKAKSVKEQAIIRYFLIGGLLLFCLLSFMLYNRYQLKQKANLLLKEQTKQIAQKNSMITDSIDYAKTIQDAILPDGETIHDFFPSSFIFYKPKSIVSGDFYWIGQSDAKIVFAVADCMDNGVAGAFMSLLGNNILENAIKRERISQPAEILCCLNNELIKIFEQRHQSLSSKMGMDISVITFDRQSKQFEFAGTHNSLYIIHKGAFSEIEADKITLGSFQENVIEFTNHKMYVEKDDLIYLFSDGYANQRGGADKEKFGYQSFKDLLLSIRDLDVNEQYKKLDEIFISWKGELDQTDDILVAGIRV